MEEGQGSERVLQTCRQAIEEAISHGILANCLHPQQDNSASKMEWIGDAALLAEVRRAIAEVGTADLADGDLARLAELCISNRALAGLYDRMHISELMQGDTHMMDQKRKAEVMGMMAYELQTLEREGNLVAKRALQLVTYSTITLTMPQFKSRQPRGLPSEVREAVDRLKRFKALPQDPDWTHSSLRGGKDPITDTGKLKVPDEQRFQKELMSVMVMCYQENQPMTLVERTTQHFPYIEDLDIEVAGSSNGPQDYLLYTPRDSFQFLRFRAAVLHKLFPTITSLQLLLYTASGWHSQKKCYKTSYHCVWPQLVVDRERAHVVRLKTIDTFDKESKIPGSWCHRLTEQVRAASGKDTPWETVFDITGVRAGSLRMPFNDKVVALTGKLEGRPLMPVAGYTFTFDGPNKPSLTNPEATITQHVEWVTMALTYPRESLSEEDWIRVGTVRRPPNEPITPWVSPIPRKDWSTRTKAAGGSGKRRAFKPRDPIQEKKDLEEYEEQMRAIRRRFEGTEIDFKAHLNHVMGDPEGNMSTLEEQRTREHGVRKFTWRNRKLKGALNLTLPSGEVHVQGNQEQQIFMLDLLKGWTSPWTGPIPPPPSASGGKGKGKGKGRKGKGKGKGKSKGGKGKGGKGKGGKKGQHGGLGSVYLSRSRGKGKSSSDRGGSQHSSSGSGYGSGGDRDRDRSYSRSGSVDSTSSASSQPPLLCFPPQAGQYMQAPTSMGMSQGGVPSYGQQQMSYGQNPMAAMAAYGQQAAMMGYGQPQMAAYGQMQGMMPGAMGQPQMMAYGQQPAMQQYNPQAMAMGSAQPQQAAGYGQMQYQYAGAQQSIEPYGQRGQSVGQDDRSIRQGSYDSVQVSREWRGREGSESSSGSGHKRWMDLSSDEESAKRPRPY